MQAIILAAGKGSRLGALTRNRSKAMLPVLGKPIVARVIESFRTNGIKEFIIVVSPDDSRIVQYFSRESVFADRVQFVCQAQPLGSADALRCARAQISGDFILSACDNLVSPDQASRMLTAWRGEAGLDGILSLIPLEPGRSDNSAIVEMDREWITRIVEKPSHNQVLSNIASLPLYSFTPRILDLLDRIPLSTRGEYELPDAIQLLIDENRHVSGVFLDRRLTLTDQADLLAINLHYLAEDSHLIKSDARIVGLDTQLIPPVYIEQGVIIGDHCRIGPNVFIESGCQIGDYSIIKNAVLLCGATLPSSAEVCDRVAWE
jgi:NDP-sugar pyrophosphorylase family protein